ncbi:GDSL-type esterase/lipase family protein [Austwickia chelonae]|uniref:GDSL-type esterase/lipase family protein n=1 Tax=Austwickia chelonae TaxID=100225 RepID=UPI0013C2F4C6|nr:GDSL-type esterase/lipase family protein [Austwickia chelonae]
MKTLRTRTTVLAVIFSLCLGAAAAVTGSYLLRDERAGATIPTTADTRPVAAATTTAPGSQVSASTLLSADGRAPSYGTEQPRPPSAHLPDKAARYDPDAVVIRHPDHDYGSGFHSDYGKFTREVSSADDFRRAVADPAGCLVIGDSIATFVIRDLVADLREGTGHACVHDTWPGRATEGTANALLDLQLRYGLPPQIIVMSGTNDIFNPPLFEPQMERILDAIGPERRILWVSTFDSRRPHSPRSAADERNTAWINGILTRRAASTPNLTIVPWDALFRGRSDNIDNLLSDGVHPNAAGVEAMIGLVRSSLS